MKDFSVTVQIRNNRLLERRLARGFSQGIVAQALGCGIQRYAGLENLTVSPLVCQTRPEHCVAPSCTNLFTFPATRWLCRDHASVSSEMATTWRRQYKEAAPKAWSTFAIHVAEFFETTPEEIWPEAVLSIKTPKETRQFDAAELAFALTAAPPTPLLPDESLVQEEVTHALSQSLEVLPLREREIVVRRFGLDGEEQETLEQIGTRLGVTKERVRELESRALRKLRHPSSLVSKNIRGMDSAHSNCATCPVCAKTVGRVDSHHPRVISIYNKTTRTNSNEKVCDRTIAITRRRL